MKTTIEKTFSIEQSIDKVWAFISNPAEVVTCVPGASVTEKIDDQNYKGQVSLKFGPIKAAYSGDIEIQELDNAAKKMVLYGKGLDSKGKGSAEMLMEGNAVEEGGQTTVNFTMNVTIMGKIAQFGSRLINDVSDQIFKQFIGNLQEELSGEGGDAGEEGDGDNTLNAGSLMGAVVKEKFSGIFKGKKGATETEAETEA